MRKRIVINDTMNADIQPESRTEISNDEKVNCPYKIYFTNLSALAPNITGMAIKKENSAVAGRDTPISIAPSIVEPEREVPGIIASA